jgi:hypothetical protein
MNQLIVKFLFAALLLWALAPEPSGQLQVSSGRVIVSQGGNDAVVSSAGALSSNVAQVGGAAIALGQTTMASSLPVAIASNQSAVPENVAQFGGAAVVTGTGASGSGIPRVTVSNDSQVKPWDGSNTITVKAASTTPVATDTALVVGVSPNTLGCAGQSIANTKKATISQTASTQIIAGVSSKQTYICSMVIFSATAQSVNLVEGTGTTCGTGIAGLTGGTTAATGMAFAANGSVSRGAGNGLVTFTATAADNVCLLQSSTGQVSGVLIYTQF